jgi:hypothetical protein
LVELEDPEVDRGDFLFGQVRHSGDHDPHPVAFANLLADVLRETTVGARFQRRLVSLASAETGRLPFLYLTGHGDFVLSEEERAGLRRFLASGGFLFADSCCGGLTFDLAFRREIARTVPERELRPLQPDHEIYSCFETIREVEYTTAVRASFPDLKAPFLEGLEIEGKLCVVYSRFDVGNGWEGEERPFALGLKAPDARRLGLNVIVYAMTH